MFKYIRENIKEVKEGLKRKNYDIGIIDEIIKMDEKRKEIIKEKDALRHILKKRNSEIAKFKREKKDSSDHIKELREVSKKVKNLEKELAQIEKKIKYKILKLPNVPSNKTPDYDKVVKEWKKII